MSRQLYGQAPDLRTLDERVSRLERQVRSLMLAAAALTARTATSADLLGPRKPAASEPHPPAEATPVEATPVEATPVEATPVEATPVEATPVEATPVEATPVEAGVPARPETV